MMSALIIVDDKQILVVFTVNIGNGHETRNRPLHLYFCSKKKRLKLLAIHVHSNEHRRPAIYLFIPEQS